MDAEGPIQNPEDVEAQWAVNAVRYAETYEALLERLADKRVMRLTPIDDDIYEHFRRVFPTFDIAAVTEASLKSPEAKELWRPFCDAYSKRLNDHNVGSLLRADPTKGFEEENTILVVRVQFYAIEIARNREGVNQNRTA